MEKIEISDETIRKINAFKIFIDYFLGEELPDDFNYSELILTIGLNQMLQDPLPKEEILLKTMVDLFHKKPEFICKYIIEKIELGTLIQKEEAREIGKTWRAYIV